MSEDRKAALLLGAIWRLCEGDVSKFLPPGRVPKEIKRFLDSGTSMRARRAALVAILQSIIADEVKKNQNATDLMRGSSAGSAGPDRTSRTSSGSSAGLAKLLRRVSIDVTPSPGFREELWQRMLALLNKVHKRGGDDDPGGPGDAP